MANVGQIDDQTRNFMLQHVTWRALRESINGLVKKVDVTNIKNIISELFSENLIRGRRLFRRACTNSQKASPGSSDVYAALVAVVNAKFPQVGLPLLQITILRFQMAYQRSNKDQLLVAAKFIAHLVNQQVVHEVVALELVTLLVKNPSDDRVEVAVGFLTECGSKLQDLSPQGLHGIFERFQGILDEGEIDKSLIEGLFALRKTGFQGHPALRPELDLVRLGDQVTHKLSLHDKMNLKNEFAGFELDPDFIENEKRYQDLKKTILAGCCTESMLASLSFDGNDDALAKSFEGYLKCKSV